MKKVITYSGNSLSDSTKEIIAAAIRRYSITKTSHNPEVFQDGGLCYELESITEQINKLVQDYYSWLPCANQEYADEELLWALEQMNFQEGEALSEEEVKV